MGINGAELLHAASRCQQLLLLVATSLGGCAGITIPSRFAAAATAAAAGGIPFLWRRSAGDAAMAIPLATWHLQQWGNVAIGVIGTWTEIAVNHFAHRRGSMAATDDALALVGGLVDALIAVPARDSARY